MATSWRVFAMPFFARLHARSFSVLLPAVLAAFILLVASGVPTLLPDSAHAASHLKRSSRTPVLTIAYAADSKGYFDPCPT